MSEIPQIWIEKIWDPDEDEKDLAFKLAKPLSAKAIDAIMKKMKKIASKTRNNSDDDRDDDDDDCGELE